MDFQNFPVPSNLKKLRGFLQALCSYYRSSINLPDRYTAYNTRTPPCRWDARTQAEFDTLKHSLISPRIVAFLDSDKPFSLFTDACIDGSRVVLIQYKEGREYVISYAASATNKHELKEPRTELQLLGVVYYAT